LANNAFGALRMENDFALTSKCPSDGARYKCHVKGMPKRGNIQFEMKNR